VSVGSASTYKTEHSKDSEPKEIEIAISEAEESQAPSAAPVTKVNNFDDVFEDD
jgi:hypothetical protein